MRVKAVNEIGASEWSNTLNVETPGKRPGLLNSFAIFSVCVYVNSENAEHPPLLSNIEVAKIKAEQLRKEQEERNRKRKEEQEAQKKRNLELKRLKREQEEREKAELKAREEEL